MDTNNIGSGASHDRLTPSLHVVHWLWLRRDSSLVQRLLRSPSTLQPGHGIDLLGARRGASHVQLIMPDMWCTGAGFGGTPPYFSDDVTTVPQSPAFERLLRQFWSECVRFLVDSFHRLS